MDENDTVKTKKLTRANIPEIAKATGRTEDALLRALLTAKARNQEVVILMERPFWRK